MKGILTIVILFTSVSVWSKGNNNLVFVASPQYYFNKYNIRNDNVSPNPIIARNTMGYYFGAGYERITKYGFSFGAELRIGERKHIMSIYRDLTDFDTAASVQLNGIIYNKTLQSKLYYINPALTIGYQRQFSSDLIAVVRAGIMVTSYLNGLVDVNEVDASYLTDDMQTNKTVRFLAYQATFGEPLRNVRSGNYSLLSKIFGHTLNVGSIYIGVKHPCKKRFLSNWSVGIEFTRSLSTNAVGLQWMEVKSRRSANSSDGSIDTYQDQNVSIGLRLGCSLWK